MDARRQNRTVGPRDCTGRRADAGPRSAGGLDQWPQAVQVSIQLGVVLVDRKLHGSIAKAFECLAQAANAHFPFAAYPRQVNFDRDGLFTTAGFVNHITRRADHDGAPGAIWQAFAVLLPVQTVGVMGDFRTYEYVCALRAVTSVDGMTADFYHYDMEFLGRAATRIINEVRGINRVVYDVTSKPPGTIEWE